MEAVRDYPNTACCGSNGSGKDWVSGRLILWWLSCFYPAKVTVLGPTNRQVNQIVFDELRSALRSSRVKTSGRIYERALYRVDESHNAIGVATDSEFSLTGRHTPNGLIIITEAHAVAEEHIRLVRTLSHKRLLMTGNPFSDSGEFFDAFHSKSDRYHTISISAFDTPNLIEGKEVIPGMVTKELVEEKRRDMGEDSPFYIASVLGQFPDNSEDAIIPLSAVSAAMEREYNEEVREATGPVILSCDVARKGEDRTVITLRQGHVAKILWDRQGKRTTETAGYIKNYCKEHEEVKYVVVDDAGVGGGVSDILYEARSEGQMLNVQLIEFNGGAKSTQPTRFADRNSEIWWATRKWFLEEEPVLNNNDTLKSELVGRKYTYNANGAIKIESKDKLAKSPDYADSLCMSLEPELGRFGEETLEGEHTGRSKWNVEGNYSFPNEDDDGQNYDNLMADFGESWGNSRWRI